MGDQVVRKFSVVCAVAAALFLPLPAFAGHHGDDHGWHRGSWDGDHGHEWRGGGGPDVGIYIGPRYSYYGYAEYPYGPYGYYSYGYGYYSYYGY
jgi:hypothetical protein